MMIQGNQFVSKCQRNIERVCNVKLKNFSDRIFTALEEVKADQKKLKKLFLQHVKKGTANGNDNVNAESLPRDTFRLTSLEAVDDFERSFVDNTSLKTQVVKHLVAFDGRTVVEDTRRKLEEIFSNQVAERYNLSGKGNKQKRAFQQLALCRLLFGKNISFYAPVF
ncbi:uncharacterized protein LOC106171045 [Lingula anatina]|uniref:Uncharacterized protein LOC106171045 n=1 Tax=Lingula anatina TaxID=7574 RepID=A0A1S3J8F6_LINAN|nr:uncharacterized protein LOC106171045 [Lingula anatina]|eukprot:XP_013406593.1 uncharacterized protein LOC106171045 [Lingula anatina]